LITNAQFHFHKLTCSINADYKLYNRLHFYLHLKIKTKEHVPV
jgi:hypothetical protein